MKLPGAWNTSVARAVIKLAKCNPIRITQTKHKLTSTEEFLQHFPNKTLSARMRHLRRKLLPVLLDDSNPEFYSRYSRARNESYFLEQRESRPAIVEAARVWKHSEPALMNLLTAVPTEAQRALFLLICKGKQLFASEEVSAKGGFLDYAEAVLKTGILSPPLEDHARTICDLVLPKTLEQHLSLKSKLYSLVNLGSRGSRTQLKPESLDWLNKRCPDCLVQLRGYQAPTKARKGLQGWMHDPRDLAVKCPELDRLIDATALQAFRFLEIPA
jgi:hypothetical protein